MANEAAPLSNERADERSSAAPTGVDAHLPGDEDPIPTPRWDRGAVQVPRQLRQLRTFADWMDGKYVDPLLGLFLPGAGDAVASLMGIYAVIVARQLHMHPIVMARMLLNLGLDALIGSIPFVGWVLDFFFKAHSKNLALLESRAPEGGEATTKDWLVVFAASVFFLVALAAPILLLAFALTYLIRS